MTSLPASSRPPPVPRRSLRRFLTYRMLLVAAVPTVVAAAYYSWTGSQRARVLAENRLQEASQICAQYVADYFTMHRQAVVAVSSVMQRTGPADPANLSHWLAETRAAYSGLLTMLVADRHGTLIAASPTGAELGLPQTLMGASVADRAYFQQPMQTGRPYVSGVFRGRAFGQDPIVAVSAPLRNGAGEVVGVVEGSLRLAKFDLLRSRFASLPESDFLILDQEQRIVYSSLPTRFPVLAQLPEGFSRRASAVPPGTTFEYETPRDESGPNLQWIVSAAEARIADPNRGWLVYVLQERSESLREIRRFLLLTGLSLAALLLGVVWVGRVVGSSTVRPIEELARFARSVATTEKIPAATPSFQIAEIEFLHADFRSMLERLNAAHQLLQNNLAERDTINRELLRAQEALKESHAGLERTVQARTAELSVANTALTAGVAARDRTNALLAGQGDVLHLIASSAPLEDILEKLLRVTAAHSPALGGAILWADSDGERIRLVAGAGLPPALRTALANTAVAARSETPILAANFDRDPIWADCRTAAATAGVKSSHSYPLCEADQTAVGLLLCFVLHDGAAEPPAMLEMENAVRTATIALTRQRAFDALQASRAQLNLIYNAVADPIILYQVEPEPGVFRLVSFNEAYRKTVADLPLVRDPDELIGLTFDELFPLVAPEDPARREELRSRLVAAVQTRQPQLFDDVALSAAGDRLYYERIDVPVLEADGRCSHVLRVSHDVTRLRAAEEALHQHFREQAALLRIAAALRDTSDLAAALDTVVAEV